MQSAKIGLVLVTFVIAVSAATIADAKRVGVEGSFDCVCSGGTGTCTVVSDDIGVICKKGTRGTCTGECKMHSETTGIGAGGIQKAKPNVAPSGGVKKY